MFLTTGEGVIVVDAPPTIGDKILKAIAEVTDEPITHVIYSHSHADHIGAAGLFPASATYIAHEDTKVHLHRWPFPIGHFPMAYLLVARLFRRQPSHLPTAIR